MSDALPLALALVVGVALGIIFFGGLWLTARQLPTTRHPALLTLGSLSGRTGITLLGFYLVMGGHWERLALSLLGFFAVRIILVRRLGPKA